MDRLQVFGETLKNHSMNVAGMRLAFWGWEGGGIRFSMVCQRDSQPVERLRASKGCW